MKKSLMGKDKEGYIKGGEGYMKGKKGYEWGGRKE